ncbi:MAG TPA: SRPBCC family protein [Planctomycetota bacterium]|nr:SRPBCC family protein [Planctomycetota bacterium]
MISVEAPQAKSAPMTAQRRKLIPRQMRKANVGESERAVSVAAGAILMAFGLKRRSLAGLLVAGVGGALTHRGVTGYCHLNHALGVDTAQERGIHVEQAFLINRTPEELFAFWRDFSKLPQFMQHLLRVDVFGDKHSHWVAKAPNFLGGIVEWDAEITREEPNSLIAWHSMPGSDVENSGEIRFARAMGDRGTEVHVTLEYNPPAGRLGHWVAKLFGEAPWRQTRDDLRNFKRLMETGEIPTIVGQPQGTCTGVGKRATESR